MRNHFRYLLSAVVIITLSALLLSPISAKRQGSLRQANTQPTPIDKLMRAGQLRFFTPLMPFANLIAFDEGFTDFIVTKTASVEQVTAGSNVTYTIQVSNDGPDAAISAELNDPLPAGMTFVSLTRPDSWSCTTPAVGEGGTINCTNPSFAVTPTTNSDTFILIVKVPSEAGPGTFFTNIATVSSATPELNEENNSAPATTVVAGTSVDLGVSNSVNAEQVLAGSNLTYTIEVISGGTAENAKLSDTLPGDMTFVSLTSPDGWTCTTPEVDEGGTIECTNASLTATSGDVFTLITKIPPGASAGTDYTNTATVSSTTAESNEENNSSTTTTIVGTGAQITGTKTVGGSNMPGSIMSYSVVLSNSGTLPQRDNAGNEFTDVLPNELTLLAADASSGTTSANSGTNIVTWSGGIAGLDSVTINITARIKTGTAGQAITNQGVFSFDADDNGTNESSALTDDPSVGGASDPTSFTASCAANPVVTSNADNGQGSLRQAIGDACPGGTISFDPSVFNPAGGPYTITLTGGELVLNKGLTIVGPAAASLTISGNNNSRIFSVNSGTTVAISHLTLSNGRSTAGGAILNQGHLTISHSTLSDNSALGGKGGAIDSEGGALTVINSVISGNRAETDGGGLLIGGTSTAVLTNVTVTNNRANADGNSSGAGGGLAQVSSSSVTLRNVIVAGNFKGASPVTAADDVSGSIDSSSANNLIGVDTGLSGIANGTNANQVGASAAPINPLLGPLASNGGPTRTHALLSGSPALDAGSNTLSTAAGLTTDQRGAGFTRQADSADADATATVDIGAFEAQVSVQDITDKMTNEDTQLSFAFNIGEAGQINSITATSGNDTLVPNTPANLNVSGSGSTRTLNITPAANLTGTAIITIAVNGNNSQAMSDTFILTVNAVNDVPVNSVPGPQSVNENSPLTFSNANSNPISIADMDAGANSMQVTLTAAGGHLTLSGTSGLSFTVGDGTADAQLTFTGTISNINNALNGLVFTPAPGHDGAASLQIATNDQGNTGLGGALSDTDIISIMVLDGGTLAFSAAAYTVGEAAGTMTITVNRTGGTAGEARIAYATSNGTATAGQDYTASGGTLIFASGVTTQTFNVPITDDNLDEGDETVQLTLSNVTGTGSLGAPATVTLTLTDNDASPTLSINDVSVTEGNSGTTSAVFTVSLSAPSGLPVSVGYQTADGTASAPDDYQAIVTASLTLAPGETTKTITALVNGEMTAEADEHFFINLSNPVNATITDGQGRGTIVSDDLPLIRLSASSYSVDEDGLHAIVTINRLGDLSQPARVDYATSDPSGLNNCSQVTGNASSRCDYATSVGTIRFNAGESSRQVFIPIVNDAYIEGPEVFSLTLSNVTGGELDAPISATVTINDNDTEPAPHPLLSDEFFIRQLYIDFLGREPEPGAIQAWLGILNQCDVPTDCDRVAVAESFVRSPEFQERGYFIYRFYSSSLGRIPLYNEFIPDMARVSGFLSSQDLEANKAAYIEEFMNRTEFKTLYDSTLNNPTTYVDKLLQMVGLPNHPARVAWINGLTNQTLTRAQVLRQLVESAEVYTKYYNESFIVMNYFGFLRRNPDAAFQGWVDTFNHTNNYKLIINGFLNSSEYGQRFGP
jgi:uncharacterized repeat protein (TIGR01451 family)